MTDSGSRYETFEDAAIAEMVDTFYARVREDPLLAPVFARRITSWPPHLTRMKGFWTAVLRGEPTYRFGPKGPPPQIHRGIAELRPEHFTRWLELFGEVVDALFTPERAAHVMQRAYRMAGSLGRHLTAS